MTDYVFHGVVLPERVNFIISKMNYKNHDETISLVIECAFSKIVVHCSCLVPDINLLTLKNFVEIVCRILVDSAGYTTANGYDLVIESCYDLNGNHKEANQLIIFGTHENIFNDPKINNETSQGIPHPDIIIPVYNLAALVFENIELQIALSDFREAIRQPNFTSFHCYRAIEALRHVFNGKENEQWEALYSTFSIIKSDVYDIKKSAGLLRHGQLTQQSWEIRKKHMLLTWEIIKKYIEWKLNKLLPPSN